MEIERIVEQVSREVLSRMEGQGPKEDLLRQDVPAHIEHSLLNPDISKERIAEECLLARKYGFANVCVSPYYVSLAVGILRGTGVAVCAPVGFPHGAASTAAKICEIRECMKNGAGELDVALNALAVKSGEWADARDDLDQMVETAGGKASIKAIYEQSLYTEDEKRRLLEMVRKSGCEFVKISNALTGKPAKEEDVAFVRCVVGRNVKIKIDGGIKTLQRAMEVLGAGADRIGLSASAAVAREALAK